MNEDILKKLIKLRDKFNDAGRSPGFNETLFNLMNILIEQGTIAPDDGSKKKALLRILEISSISNMFGDSTSIRNHLRQIKDISKSALKSDNSAEQAVVPRHCVCGLHHSAFNLCENVNCEMRKID